MFDLVQMDGKPDEYKCKECDKTYTVAGSVKKHYKAKHKRKDQETNEESISMEERLLEEEDSVNGFNPDDDNVYKSTQNGDKTLSAEDIIKLYEDKENSDDDEAMPKDSEQTLFPEKEIYITFISQVNATCSRVSA